MDGQFMEVVLLIGLAVGVDYSLFYLRRERDERAAGRSERAALEAAAATSGHAVLISGITVLIAMAGMFLSGDKHVHVVLDRHDDRRRRRHDRLAHGAAGSALQARRPGREGPHPVPPPPAPRHGRRQPLLGRDPRARPAPPGDLRRSPPPPCSSCSPCPTLQLHTADRPAWTAAQEPARAEGVPRARQGLPGRRQCRNGGDQGRRRHRSSGAKAIAELKPKALAIRRDARPDQRRAERRRHGVPRSRSRSPATARTRPPTTRSPPCATTSCPPTVGTVPTASSTPSPASRPTRRTSTRPDEVHRRCVFGFVLLFAFGLLLVAFRSIVIAVKAILLNLLSVAAAYGVLVAVFQWGWGENLLNFNPDGGIANWLPMFMFVILFGLSMDYHVFILSRIREALRPRPLDRRGRSRTASASHGRHRDQRRRSSWSGVRRLHHRCRCSTSRRWASGSPLAVLIDATLVRAVLLPATMKLLGERQLVPAELARVAAQPRARAGAAPSRSPSPRATSPTHVHRPRPRTREAGARPFHCHSERTLT